MYRNVSKCFGKKWFRDFSRFFIFPENQSVLLLLPGPNRNEFPESLKTLLS